MAYRSYSLEKLISICTSSSGSAWEAAWTELLNRYRDRICYYVETSCNKWDVRKLNLEREDFIKDVLSNVFIILNKSLHTFKNRDSEYQFHAWLHILCNRATTRQINHFCRNYLNNYHTDDLSQFKQFNDPFSAEELYDSLVDDLRKCIGNQDQKESKINIFMLHTWSGFSIKSILQIPVYKDFKPNSIEIFISRLRKKLKAL